MLRRGALGRARGRRKDETPLTRSGRKSREEADDPGIVRLEAGKNYKRALRDVRNSISVLEVSNG